MEKNLGKILMDFTELKFSFMKKKVYEFMKKTSYVYSTC